ncbi:MAG: GlxA family transcriptional regulator [Parafilimonas terrae]|nr:GlxA family transcriptional regulator [Parafilimonas terrae]
MSQAETGITNESRAAPGDRPQEIGFILVPGFALLSFAAACEPFRAANDLAGQALYRLRYFGEDSRAVSSSGAEVPTEELPRQRGQLHTVFVVAGGEPTGWDKPAIHAALRRLARFGVRIGGISGGPHVMAAAGLLEDRALALHWEYAGAALEAFPRARITRARYVIEADRLTCGGGVAPLDMAHALITERMGAAFARRVSDWFLHTAVGAAKDSQRASTTERYGVHHPALLTALETMETTIEAPLSRRAMARLASVSERHLDRLFLDKCGVRYSAQYRAIRLEQGRRLLRQSPLRVSEIATACGFSSAAHFSRSYRSHFGCSPSSER